MNTSNIVIAAAVAVGAYLVYTRVIAPRPATTTTAPGSSSSSGKSTAQSIADAATAGINLLGNALGYNDKGETKPKTTARTVGPGPAARPQATGLDLTHYAD